MLSRDLRCNSDPMSDRVPAAGALKMKCFAPIVTALLLFLASMDAAFAGLPYGAFVRSLDQIVVTSGPSKRGYAVSVHIAIPPPPDWCSTGSGTWNLDFIFLVPESYGGEPVASDRDTYGGTWYCDGGTINFKQPPGSKELTATFAALGPNEIQFTVVSFTVTNMNLSSYSGIYNRAPPLGRHRLRHSRRHHRMAIGAK